MSRLEVVGLFDCPWYAKAEKIAEEIVTQNPAIEFHKEMMDSMQWKEFVTKMNIRQGWDIKHSPCVYEVLADRESKAHLIGDMNDFCEFAKLYFDVSFDPSTAAIKDMVIANRALYGRGNYDSKRGSSEIFNIAIVNAPLPTLELMLTQLLSPCSMIPLGLLLNIYIFDEFTPKRILDGLLMEITDMASPHLHKARVVTTLPMAFYRCHLFLLMDDFSRSLMEEPKDWLNRIEFKIVRIMNSFNSKRTKVTDCRILVGGDGPCCYVAEICRKMSNFANCGPGKVVASGQHVVQRAKAEIGKIGSLPSGAITRLHAYGWPGMTGCYVEVKDATVRGGSYSMRGPGVEIPLSDIATRSNYIFTQFSTDFLNLQQQRLAYLVKQPNRFMCMAESAISTIHTWLMCDPLVRLMGEGVYSVTPSAAELVSDGLRTSDSCLPVLNVGIECPVTSDFPSGTFMIQPAVCASGKWQPLGKISTKTSIRITEEVSKLWEMRQTVIYRDVKISDIFPEYEDGSNEEKVVGSLTEEKNENVEQVEGEEQQYEEIQNEAVSEEEGGLGYTSGEEEESRAKSYDVTSDEN